MSFYPQAYGFSHGMIVISYAGLLFCYALNIYELSYAMGLVYVAVVDL